MINRLDAIRLEIGLILCQLEQLQAKWILGVDDIAKRGELLERLAYLRDAETVYRL